MTASSDTHIPDARHIGALWTALLLPPIAFLLSLEAAYALVGEACSSRNTVPIHLVHAGSIAIVVVAAVIGWRTWRSVGIEWPGSEGGRISRSRFLAGLAVLMSAFFILLILSQWIPTFMLHPCQ